MKRVSQLAFEPSTERNMQELTIKVGLSYIQLRVISQIYTNLKKLTLTAPIPWIGYEIMRRIFVNCKLLNHLHICSYEFLSDATTDVHPDAHVGYLKNLEYLIIERDLFYGNEYNLRHISELENIKFIQLICEKEVIFYYYFFKFLHFI